MAHVHAHITEREISLFASGVLEGLALQQFVRHLLSPCRECQNKLAAQVQHLAAEDGPPPGTPEVAPDEYEAAMDRAIAKVQRQLEQREAEKTRIRFLLKKQRRLSDGTVRIQDRRAVQDDYAAWIEAHLILSHELRYSDPAQMLIIAWGAVAATRKLGQTESDRARYTPAQIVDLQARALIELANAQRLNHKYTEAEMSLEEAAGLLEKGMGDLLTVGRIMDVHASLCMDQRRLDEALDLLGRLHIHYLAVGETHLAGRALISKGLALHRDERPREAVAILREGLAALVPEREPKLLASGQHTLILSLVEAGEYGEAGKQLLESRLRQEFADDPLNLLKLRWVEGKIFAGLGKLQRAEEIFSEVQEEFRRRDRKYLVAMLGLELAEVLLRQGRSEEVEPLAQEALEIFQELRVDREALRAVHTLRNACRRRLATAELVRRVVTFLHRLERRPGLRFAL